MALKTLFEEEQKKVEKVAEKVEDPLDVKVIVETLRKLKEQIDIFPEFYARLQKIEANQVVLSDLINEIVVLLKGRVAVLNELDAKESELMDALFKKMSK